MDWDFAVQQAAPKSTIPFRFYEDAIHDPDASAKEGRAIYVDKEMIEFRIPGTNETRVYEVTEKHKMEHPAEYAAFKAHQPQEALTGTPLKLWPPMTPAWVKMAAAGGIHTVEQVAGLSDLALQRLGPGWTEIRMKARDWLDSAQGGVAIQQVRRENEALRAQMAVLTKMVEEQAKALGHPAPKIAEDPPPNGIVAVPINQPKRRGRPPGSKNKAKQAEG